MVTSHQCPLIKKEPGKWIQHEPSLMTDSLNYMNNDLIKSFSFSGSANS